MWAAKLCGKGSGMEGEKRVVLASSQEKPDPQGRALLHAGSGLSPEASAVTEAE